MRFEGRCSYTYMPYIMSSVRIYFLFFFYVVKADVITNIRCVHYVIFQAIYKSISISRTLCLNRGGIVNVSNCKIVLTRALQSQYYRQT